MTGAKAAAITAMVGTASAAVFGQADTTGLVSLIGNVGFPMAVAVYLLVVLRQDLREFRRAIDANTNATEKLADRIDRSARETDVNGRP